MFPAEIRRSICLDFQRKFLLFGFTSVMGQEYSYGNTMIKFKRTTNREISKISYKTALVIRALKALGKENITAEIIDKIVSTTTDEEKATMFVEAKYATSWIYDIIIELCGGARRET